MSDGWRSRITGHGEVAPASLKPHPQNPRTHPPGQLKALAGALTEVGWVQDVIVNKRTGHLVDGHARVELAAERGEAKIPVVYVDLDENEEGMVLAALDPLAAMAGTDQEKLDALLAEVRVSDEALREILGQVDPDAEWAGPSGPDQQAIEQREGALGTTFQERAEAQAEEMIALTCPECGEEFNMRLRDILNVLKNR